MATRYKDISGSVSGMLTAINYSHSKEMPSESRGFSKVAMWDCKCECGKIVKVMAHTIMQKSKKTCGETACLRIWMKRKKES